MRNPPPPPYIPPPNTGYISVLLSLIKPLSKTSPNVWVARRWKSSERPQRSFHHPSTVPGPYSLIRGSHRWVIIRYSPSLQQPFTAGDIKFHSISITKSFHTSTTPTNIPYISTPPTEPAPQWEHSIPSLPSPPVIPIHRFPTLYLFQASTTPLSLFLSITPLSYYSPSSQSEHRPLHFHSSFPQPPPPHLSTKPPPNTPTHPPQPILPHKPHPPNPKSPPQPPQHPPPPPPPHKPHQPPPTPTPPLNSHHYLKPTPPTPTNPPPPNPPFNAFSPHLHSSSCCPCTVFC